LAKNTKPVAAIMKTNPAAKTSPRKAHHKRSPTQPRKPRPLGKRMKRTRSQKQMKERSSGDDQRLMVVQASLRKSRRSRGRENGLVLGKRERRLRLRGLRRREIRGRVLVVRSRLLRKRSELVGGGRWCDERWGR
jgi:hypothetical protein